MFQPGFGWELKIIRSRRKTVSIELKPNILFVRVPLFVSDREVDEILKKKENWIYNHQKIVLERQERANCLPVFSTEELAALARKAKEVIPEKVKVYASRVGVDYGKITIRAQKTRWGSCSGKGNLNFNCLLMLFPDQVIDSVIVHELCHRKHMNHSAAFYSEVRKVYPYYDQCNSWLKKNGGQYLSRLPK